MKRGIERAMTSTTATGRVLAPAVFRLTGAGRGSLDSAILNLAPVTLCLPHPPQTPVLLLDSVQPLDAAPLRVLMLSYPIH